MRRLLLLPLLAGVVAWPRPAGAQEWRVAVDAGRIRSALDPTAGGSQTLAVGVGFDGPVTGLRLSAGIPTPNDSMRWTALGLWKRLAATRNGFTAGIDLSGNAFGFRTTRTIFTPGKGGLLDPLRPAPSPTATTDTVMGRVLAAQALPVVAYDAGPLQLQARAGVAYHDATVREAARHRMANVGDLQLAIRVSPAFAVVPLLRVVAPRGEEAATFAGVSAVAAAGAGRVRLWGNSGWWAGRSADRDGRSATWSAGGELRVASFASVNASARRDGYDPLHLTPTQSSWSVGASFLLGRRARTPASPVAERDARGAATIRLPLSASPTAPSVAGDFNGWTPAPMRRQGSSWEYTVHVAEGVYNFAFVAADGTWFVPEGVPGRRDDGMGGHVATVVVR